MATIMFTVHAEVNDFVSPNLVGAAGTLVHFDLNIPPGNLIVDDPTLIDYQRTTGYIRSDGKMYDRGAATAAPYDIQDPGTIGVRLLANDPDFHFDVSYTVTLEHAWQGRDSDPRSFHTCVVPSTDIAVNLATLLIQQSGPTPPPAVEDTFYSIGPVGSAYTLDLKNGTLQECVLTPSYATSPYGYPLHGTSYDPDECVFTMPTMEAGQRLTLVVKQPVVGTGHGRWAVGNAVFPDVRWINGIVPTSTRALRNADVYEFFSDGTTIYGSVSQGHIYHAPFDYAATIGPRRQKGTANPTYSDDQNFWTPVDVANIYQLPAGDGSGVTVGCVQLEGPPNVAVLQAYSNYLGNPDPLDIQLTYMPGTESQIGNPAVTGEAMLDMCALVAVVPKATHKVYMGVNNWQGIVDVTRRALAECDLVSFSWLGSEINYFNADAYGQSLDIQLEFEDMLREARSRGVSFFVSSGDFGAEVWVGYDTTTLPWHAAPRRLGAPANCPSAVSVGMTGIHTDIEGHRVSEFPVSWGVEGSTGGYSRIFPDTRCPVVSCFGGYQQGFAMVLPTGQWISMSSTSGSAPFMAAVHARLIQVHGHRFDFMDFALANPDAFHDVTTGSNGAFDATAGRDLVTGLGTPNGPALLAALTNWSHP